MDELTGPVVGRNREARAIDECVHDRIGIGMRSGEAERDRVEAMDAQSPGRLDVGMAVVSAGDERTSGYEERDRHVARPYPN
jgi:hypothetical protein